MIRTLLIVILTALSFFTVPCGAVQDAPAQGELREKATIAYEADFVVDAPAAVWNKLLDHLVLLGTIWNFYQFQPAYEIIADGRGIKVVDPSGIKGEMVLLDKSQTSRTYYCRGSVDHWAIPSFISAEGIFVFRCEEENGQRMRGRFEVYLRGENEVADFLVRLVAGRLKQRLHSRFTHNLEDMKKIIFDSLYHPDHIRSGLTGDALQQFNRLF